MIYEVRTYNLKAGSVPEFERRFAAKMEGRSKHSPLAAFFHTEIGPLNQVIHIWPYENLAERERIRGEAVAAGDWPPDIGEFIVRMESEIMIPYEFSPELKPGKLGPYFEIRSYQLAYGQVKVMPERWMPTLEARTQLSPLVAVWHTELGPLNKLFHIWGYESLDQRAEVRKEASRTGIWPGKGGEPQVSMENKIVVPASFSPLQ